MPTNLRPAAVTTSPRPCPAKHTTADAAVGAGAIAPARAQTAAVDLAAGRAIGEAYRAAFPGEAVETLRDGLVPAGLDAAALGRLKEAVASDFRAADVFIYQGWRLSRTEGRLFALLTA